MTRQLSIFLALMAVNSGAMSIEHNFIGSHTEECTHIRQDITISDSESEYTAYPTNLGGGYDKLFFVRNTESFVNIWEREDGIIKENTCNSWRRVSNVLPTTTSKAIIVAADGCTFTIPETESDLPDAQLVFHTYYKSEIGVEEGDSKYWYFESGSGKMNLLDSQQKRKWSEVKKMEPACLDIYINTLPEIGQSSHIEE